MNEFVIHGCEQALRFSSVANWGDLAEDRQVQLAFNMGVVSLGLNLAKEAGYDWIAGARAGTVSMQAFHEHVRSLVITHAVLVNEENVHKPI